MAEKNYTKKILDNFPTFYARHSTSNNYKVINPVGLELDYFGDEKINLVTELYIDTAVSTYLDGIGALFRLIRQSDESDIEFRARIKGHWQSNIGGGTIESIRTAISNVMRLPTSSVEISEEGLKIGVKVIITEASQWELYPTAINTAELTKAAGTFITIDFEPNFVITGRFTAGVSSVGMRDVV